MNQDDGISDDLKPIINDLSTKAEDDVLAAVIRTITLIDPEHDHAASAGFLVITRAANILITLASTISAMLADDDLSMEDVVASLLDPDGKPARKKDMFHAWLGTATFLTTKERLKIAMMCKEAGILVCAAAAGDRRCHHGYGG